MKKILMVSYAFPPMPDVGGLRAYGFSRHLAPFGWTPDILTAALPRRPGGAPRGEDDPEDVPQITRCRSLLRTTGVTRALNSSLRALLSLLRIDTSLFVGRDIVAELFCIPDPCLGWIPSAVLAGRRLVRRNDIDLIYATCGPFSAGVAGVLLKMATGRPLILDARDPFRVDLVLDYLGASETRRRELVPGPFKVRMRIDREIESWMVRWADRLIVTNDETKALYEAAYPELRGRVVRIYNGFHDHLLDAAPGDEGGRFTLTYMGNYYYEYDPSDLVFRAVRSLLDSGKIRPETFQLLWVGALPRWLAQARDRLGLQPVFRSTGQVPRREAAEHLQRTSLLLVRIVRPCLSTKMFEGLAAGVPILATIEPGEAERLIRQYSRRHYIVRPGDLEGVKAAILDALAKRERGELRKVADERYRSLFSKEALTLDLSRTLDEVARAHARRLTRPVCLERDGAVSRTIS